MSLREPLARAKGHGSAKEGTRRYIAYRVTSLAMVVFIPWFLISVINNLHADYSLLIVWLKNPLTTIMGMLFLIIFGTHFWLELRVVVEDYVATPMRRYATLIALKFALFIVVFTGVFSLLKIAFGA